MLPIGATAPDFERPDQRGQIMALDELTRAGPVVLYFYPKDFTTVCTREACFFRDAYEDLRGKDAHIVGVSMDTDETHGSFAAKYNLPFSLLSDRDGSLATAYDVRAFVGPLTKRVTYVIDRNKTVRGVFHYELRAKKHVDEVLRCLSTLGG
jgi:peroxiredoxin Q/BCP